MHVQRGDQPSVLVHVGANLRRLRSGAGLSQAALAERSGVSRRTIINLEAGDANVGLTTLDQLAGALGSSFTDLVAAPSAPRASINAVAWRSGPGTATLLGSAPARDEAQLWSWTLGPGQTYQAEPDPDGWSEMLVVTAGRLVVAQEDQTVELRRGDHAIYSSSQRYSYRNVGDEPAAFIRVVVS
ncbi:MULTISPECIES: helix-turn-helix domain-containing protein [Curtobacterium]|uniref:helix-turn-helix domain-containing protein n=1 Tax=Curtobacterium flaccumfaciens TaxID=2035 RepID=UPI003EE7AD8A